MEWNRAKTIFIISFLCLNLLLAYQLLVNKGNEYSDGFESNELMKTTYKLLEEHNIRLVNPIPEATPTLKEITVELVNPFTFEEKKMLDPPVDANIIGRENQLSEFLESIEQSSSYKVDKIYNQSNPFVLNQIYNDLPMFEINLTLYMKEDHIYAYTQRFVEVEAEFERKEQKVLSAYKAVNSLIENHLSFGTVILDVSLGYHGQNYNSQTQVLAPKWRIALTNGDIYYVHGINGEVEESTQKE